MSKMYVLQCSTVVKIAKDNLISKHICIYNRKATLALWHLHINKKQICSCKIMK